MIRPSKLEWGEEVIEDCLSFEESWSETVEALEREGLNEEEVTALLRQREAWTAEARELKAEGYPYDEIIFHLTTLRAPLPDVGRALMTVGLSPADMLRVVLPFAEGDELWNVVQVALLDGPEDADYAEVRGLLGFYFMNEQEVLGALDVDDVQRRRAAERLGIEG